MLSERELLAAFAALPGYVTVIAPNRRVVWLNRCGFGFRREDVVGTDSALLVAESDRPKWSAILARVFGCGETAEYVVRTLTPAGEALIVGFIAPVVIDGAARYAVCRTLDTTHRPPGSCALCLHAAGEKAPKAPEPPPAETAVVAADTVGPRGAPADPRWRALSHLEEKILTVLAGAKGGWRSSRLVANELDLGDTERLKAILTNMVDAGVIEACAGRGYRWPKGVEPGQPGEATVG